MDVNTELWMMSLSLTPEIIKRSSCSLLSFIIMDSSRGLWISDELNSVFIMVRKLLTQMTVDVSMQIT